MLWLYYELLKIIKKSINFDLIFYSRLGGNLSIRTFECYRHPYEGDWALTHTSHMSASLFRFFCLYLTEGIQLIGTRMNFERTKTECGLIACGLTYGWRRLLGGCSLFSRKDAYIQGRKIYDNNNWKIIIKNDSFDIECQDKLKVCEEYRYMRRYNLKINIASNMF